MLGSNPAQSSENSPLLGNPASLELTRLERALKHFGWTCTLLAMSAQGFQGMMLMDYLAFQKLPFYGRMALDILFLIAVEESKRRIVTTHNEQNFIHLARVEWKNILNPFNWNRKQFFWQTLVNIPLTIGGTYVFMAITGMSLDADIGGASLLKTYNEKTLNKIAAGLNSRLLQILFMLPAMFANLLFFPTIINLAYNHLKSWVTSPLEGSDYRSLKEQMTNYYEDKRRALKIAYESNNQTETQKLLSEIHNLLQNTIYPDECQAFTPNTPTKNLQRTLLALLAIIGSAAGCIGFFSIYQLGGKPSAIKMIRVFSAQEHSNFMKLAPLLSVLSYGATMAICIALAPNLVRELVRFRLWNKESAQIKVSSNFGLCVNAFYALVICSLGTLPFIYQSYKILDEPTWLIVMVGIASLSIEAQSAREKCSPINNEKSSFYGEAKAYFGGFLTMFYRCRQSEAEKNKQREKHQMETRVEEADRGLIALQNNTTTIETIIGKSTWKGDRFQPWVSNLFRRRCCKKVGGSSTDLNINTNPVNPVEGII